MELKKRGYLKRYPPIDNVCLSIFNNLDSVPDWG